MTRQNEQEKSFWNNQNTASYFAAKPADPRITTFIQERYGVIGGKYKALDLGCGGGRHTEWLAEKGFVVSSIDPNRGMLKATYQRLEAKELSADVCFGEILDIPYKDATFDLVIATGVLHQAHDIEEYILAVDELSRVMKKGAYVCLNIFTNTSWDSSYVVTSKDRFSVITTDGLPMTLLPRNKLIAIMGGSGFRLVSDYPEDIRQENTGKRSVYRANFQKI